MLADARGHRGVQRVLGDAQCMEGHRGVQDGCRAPGGAKFLGCVGRNEGPSKCRGAGRYNRDLEVQGDAGGLWGAGQRQAGGEEGCRRGTWVVQGKMGKCEGVGQMGSCRLDRGAEGDVGCWEGADRDAGWLHGERLLDKEDGGDLGVQGGV